jgi:hypothetical protein
VNATLKEDYLYPEIVQKMAEALLRGQRRSDKSIETDGDAFAFLITDQLRDISHDKHLDVIYTHFRYSSSNCQQAAITRPVHKTACEATVESSA